MATATVQLAAIKSAYVNAGQPSTVFPTDAYTNYLLGNSGNNDPRRLFFGFDALPAELGSYALLGAQFMCYNRDGGSTDLIVETCAGDFDPTTTTWDNQPQTASGTYRNIGRFDAPVPPTRVWANRLSDFYSSNLSARSEAAALFCKNLGIRLTDRNGSSVPVDYTWYAKTVLANGSAPYVLISYDPDITLTSKVANFRGDPFLDNFYANTDERFQWDLVDDSSTYRSAAVWEQASAIFFWKYTTENTWHQIAVSGSTQSIIIPKNTWMSGSTVQCYVQVTDTKGTTTQSEVLSATAARTQLTVIVGPQNGYKNPREVIQFLGRFAVQNSAGLEHYFLGTWSLFWKTIDDETYTEIPGNTTSLYVPANTFPVATTIQWYMSGVDETGYASRSPLYLWYSFSTAAGTAYALAQKPVNTIEDGTGQITFSWLFTSTDGQAPTAVDLSWKLPSESSSEFHTLLDHATAVTSYDVPAGTFPAGEIQWIVRAYNIDDTPGPWSRPSSSTYYSFICLAAPDPVEGLTTDNVPFVTVSWQSAEQQAYEIQIDGKVVQKEFGPDVYSWTSPDYLEDGGHEITVRVQGQYGLWSQPVTAYCDIHNQAAGEITLTGEFGTDAALSWETKHPVSTDITSLMSETGYYINTSGVKTSGSSSLCVSAFIPINAGDRVEYTNMLLTSSMYVFAFYTSESDSSYVSGSGVRGSGTTTNKSGSFVAEQDGYFRISTRHDKISSGGTIVMFYQNQPVFNTNSLIYRDNNRIGKTNGLTFTDRFTLGEHAYFIIDRLADGNYIKSNTVTGLLSVENSMIAEFRSQDAAWLSLQLTERSNGIQSFQKSRTHSLRHFSGAEYPVAELSPYADLSGQYDTAFPAGDPRSAALEALYGKQVILKSRRGNVVIGVLTQLQKNVLLFYDSYSFTLRQIHWEDFVDDTSD